MAYHASVLVTAVALYLVFAWWYGGQGRPLSAEEKHISLQRFSNAFKVRRKRA